MKSISRIKSILLVLSVLACLGTLCLAAGAEDLSSLTPDEPEQASEQSLPGEEEQSDAPGPSLPAEEEEEEQPSRFAYEGDADHVHDWHYVWDGGLCAVCSECGETAQVGLKTGRAFCYCPGDEVCAEEWVEETNWDVEDAAGGFGDTSKLASYHFVYAAMDSDSWQEGIPSAEGTYKAAVCLDAYLPVEDVSGDYGAFETYATVRIGHCVNEEWTADGKLLCNCCPTCGIHLAELSMEDSVGNACSEQKLVPKFSTWYLDESFEDEILDVFPQFIMLFEGTGDTDYPLSTRIPGVAGTYNACFAQMDDFEDLSTITLRTQPVTYTVKAHAWEYTADEYSIHADCKVCDAHAEVCIDTSTVYEASRTYMGGALDYEVFYETDWSRQEDIEPYSVLFSGLETVSETVSTRYDHAFVKPRTTGNYTVRLAMLSDPDDPDTAWVSTKEKPYYLADISIGECDVLTYGPTQIAQFKEPQKSGGYYQVGTLSELLWCLSKQNLNANISLTNDIVVNPITVNEDGEVHCASYQIYQWIGFGTEKNAYTGSIRGNGYTIYGLYQPNASVHYNGFVNNGKNCNISDLTVENAVLSGIDAAAIVGHYDHTSSSEDSVSHCHSLNCYFNGSSTCGGIISWLTTDKAGTVTVQNCGNDSIISGTAEKGAGGIIGRAAGVDALYVQSCYNLGPIQSTKGKAGGIIGHADLGTSSAYIAIWDCFNTGSVTCPNYVGGIVGWIADCDGSERIYIDNCTSTGYLSAAQNLGGIAGYIDTDYMFYLRSTVLHNFYYNAKVGFKTADSAVDLEKHAIKLTRSQVNSDFICSKYEHTPCSHWTAVSSANCTRDGKLTLQCAVCDATMESETIRAYGHRYEYGECVYCGAWEDEEESLSGSIFSYPSVVIIIAGVGALLLFMVGWLLLRRRHS